MPTDFLGGCAYFEHLASIHKPVPSPWGEGQGEGARV